MARKPAPTTAKPKAKPKTVTSQPSAIPPATVLEYLYNLGYFGDRPWAKVKALRGKELEKAIKAYQKFNGLDACGCVDDVTAHWITRRRCGLPDFNMTDHNGQPCKWPMKTITYFHDINMPGLSATQVAEAYDVAFSQWAAVCDIEPLRVEAREKANIYARSGVGKAQNLDGRGGTLAWSELPCGVAPNIQLDQMFDEAEPWSFNMAVAVICHELGHALGLGHLNAGNLMAPYYDPNLTTPQAGDIEEMVRRYGKRSKKYPLTKDAGLKIGGTILINGRPYVLVPKT
jgi:hypothetical protein